MLTALLSSLILNSDLNNGIPERNYMYLLFSKVDINDAFAVVKFI